jgi:hypothetical protein
MAEHLSPAAFSGQEFCALPLSDQSCVELIKWATGWKEICLQTCQNNRLAVLQAFWPRARRAVK